MNRRNCIRKTSLASASVVFTSFAFAAQDGKIGTIDFPEWTNLNLEAGEKLKAIQPDSQPLSEADQLLLAEIAAGGLIQLELSRIASTDSSSEDVKVYAQAEIAEQTALAAKLKEIAGAKKMPNPKEPEDKISKAAEELKGKPKGDFDEHYMRLIGIEGHEKLEKTMRKVESSAADKTLKLLASTALPLIKIHLQAARDEVADPA